MPQATGYPSQTGDPAAPVTGSISTSQLSTLSTQSKASLLTLVEQRIVALSSYLASLIIKQTHLDMVLSLVLPKVSTNSDVLNKQKQTVSSATSSVSTSAVSSSLSSSSTTNLLPASASIPVTDSSSQRIAEHKATVVQSAISDNNTEIANTRTGIMQLTDYKKALTV